MKVIGTDKIDRFTNRNEGARKALNDWLLKARAAQWSNSTDIKATFSSVESVGKYHIFDIVHNRFRLVAIVVIKKGVIIIDQVMTHAKYDQWCKRIR